MTMEKQIYLAPGAVVVGDVRLGENVNIWYGAVLRGDSGTITLGERTNVQDNAVIHQATTLGAGCTVGHGAIVHGCTAGDNCMIGMGAVVLTGAVLGRDCIVGAGAVVTGKTIAPDGSLLLGCPAKVVRQLTAAEIESTRENAVKYIEHARRGLPLMEK